MTEETILQTRLEIAERRVKALRAKNVKLVRKCASLAGWNTKYRIKLEAKDPPKRSLWARLTGR